MTGNIVDQSKPVEKYKDSYKYRYKDEYKIIGVWK